MARKASAKAEPVAAAAEELKAAVTGIAKEVKSVTKKAARKTTAKTEKDAADKEPAPKKTPARRTSAKKAETNTEVYIQYWGKEVYAKDVVAAVKKIWTDEMGKKESDMTDLKVYIKPEDNGAHYVINGEITGFIRL